MGYRLQPGIHFEAGITPRRAYRLLLLNAHAGASPVAVRAGLESVFAMLRRLRAGRPAELAGQPTSQRRASADLLASLDILIGYGRRLFDNEVHKPPLTRQRRPEFLSYLAVDGPFPALRWASDRREAECDFALQLTASDAATVSTAAVEVSTLIAAQGLALVVVESFDGFGRSDGRGWLGFHDGVSNMPADQRLQAVIAPADPAWMAGGTYMAYLRLPVDLTIWRSLRRDQQELIVGRNKLTGAALTGIRHTNGQAKPIAASAPAAMPSSTALGLWRDPPQTTNPILEHAHIARANQTRASPHAPGAWRIFRQGYDFVEAIDGDVRVGLNFVSFQRDLRVLQQILHQPDWLGDANFGGSQTPQLISVAAGGLYAVPPRSTPIPGTGLLSGPYPAP